MKINNVLTALCIVISINLMSCSQGSENFKELEEKSSQVDSLSLKEVDSLYVDTKALVYKNELDSIDRSKIENVITILEKSIKDPYKINKLKFDYYSRIKDYEKRYPLGQKLYEITHDNIYMLSQVQSVYLLNKPEKDSLIKVYDKISLDDIKSNPDKLEKYIQRLVFLCLTEADNQLLSVFKEEMREKFYSDPNFSALIEEVYNDPCNNSIILPEYTD